MFLSKKKFKPVLSIFSKFMLILISFFIMYISFEGFFNFILSLLKMYFFNNNLPTILDSLYIKVYTSEALEKLHLDVSIFSLSFFIFFVLCLSYRKHDLNFKNSDLMFLPIILSLIFIIFIDSYPFWIAYQKFISQHLIFKFLYYSTFVLFIIYVVANIFIIKDIKFHISTKFLMLLFIFYFYIFIFSSISIWFEAYGFLSNIENRFETIEELQRFFDNILSMYINVVHCISENDLVSDPCKDLRENKDFWCNLSRQAGKIQSVKGGEPGPRLFTNLGVTGGKLGTKHLCDRFTIDYFDCMRNFYEANNYIKINKLKNFVKKFNKKRLIM